MKFKPAYARIALYLVVVLTIFTLQSQNYLPKIYGYSYNLLPTIIISLAILNDLQETIVFTFFISFLYDFNYSNVEGLAGIYFVIVVIIIFFVTDKYFTKSFVTNMMFVSMSLLAQKCFSFIYYYFFVSHDNFFLYFQISCAEVLIATLLSPITYALIYYINAFIKDGE